MTKHLHEDSLKAPGIEDCKVEVTQISPKIVDDTLVLDAEIVHKPAKIKVKVQMVKTKVPVKKTSRLEKATANLYDLEDSHDPEKPLDIDFGLYQMENY